MFCTNGNKVQRVAATEPIRKQLMVLLRPIGALKYANNNNADVLISPTKGGLEFELVLAITEPHVLAC